MFAMAAGAAWYWPFGDGDGRQGRLRISELLEPASELIDEASDLAEEGKVEEAVAKYGEALRELARIEAENPDRAESAEFATVRNKRAYVNSAVDSLLLRQAQRNSKAVAVTDTTELEKRYAEAKGKAKPEPAKPAESAAEGRKDASAAADLPRPQPKQDQPTRRERLEAASKSVKEGDFESAKLAIGELLSANPADVAALNLKAAVEAGSGDPRAAEATLDKCIQVNPGSYHAYYNMVRLLLRTRGDDVKPVARMYYDAGHKLGGPADAALEESLR